MKRYVQEFFHSFHYRLAFFRLNIEQQKATSASPQKFSSQGACLNAFFIQFIDNWSGYGFSYSFFQLPCLMQQSAEIIQVPVIICKDFYSFLYDFFHCMKLL